MEAAPCQQSRLAAAAELRGCGANRRPPRCLLCLLKDEASVRAAPPKWRVPDQSASDSITERWCALSSGVSSVSLLSTARTFIALSRCGVGAAAGWSESVRFGKRHCWESWLLFGHSRALSKVEGKPNFSEETAKARGSVFFFFGLCLQQCPLLIFCGYITAKCVFYCMLL